ncbi:MAG: transporter permease [Verrucomicrobia bacterium]|jgi:putative ABC transport system permease protein|nr:transporter permease [Verrucomicrobiota bacterium]
MAWRDSRTSRGRLLFFALAMLVGVAAIAGITAFGENLRQAVNEQSRSLLGADLVITSRRPFTPGQLKFFQSFNGEMSMGANLSAMISFPKSNDGRLIQLRAVEDNFPFYGEFVTEPATAKETFRKGGVLVEESLLVQYNAQVGDPVKLGNWTGVIAGKLQQIPGETVAFGAFAPRVYISGPDLGQTGLLRPESLVRFRASFRFPDSFNVDELMEQVEGELVAMRLSSDTVKERREELGQSMTNLYNFLNLSGFIALLLGGIAVGTALQLHIRHKLTTVATLRCIGVEANRTMTIYLVQALVVGLVCAFGGALVGVAVQRALPEVMREFLPFNVTFQFSWGALLRAAFFGLAFCGLFALLPLLPVRSIPPLAALRRNWEDAPSRLEASQWIVGLLLGLCVVAFSVMQSQSWKVGLGMAGGLVVAIALLAAVAQGLRRLARKAGQVRLPFVWRQGIASLHRPNNRTLVLLLSLGLGAFLLLTLRLTEHSLLHGLLPQSMDERPNAILFDIQPDQRAGVQEVLEKQGLKVMQQVPVVTMRLMNIKGTPVETILKDEKSPIPTWTMRREYRCTYRDTVGQSEELVGGQWPPPKFDVTKSIPISVEDGIAKDLQIGLGDELVFDVQGLPMNTKVVALRKVDWRRMEPNFFVVFPKGVLEEAPGFYITATHVATPEISAKMQREVLQKYANVSVIDMTLVLHTLDDIFTKVSSVIRFMALFTVATGLIVLAGTLLAARFQRVQESVLLRTLGASRQQVQQIQFVEYLCLGALAALTACLLALAANAALAWWVFKMSWVIDWLSVLLTLLVLPALTIGIGWLTNRGVANHPPLEILRAEA